MVKDRNRKEVEAKLAAAKEQKLTPIDIPMPSANKDEEAKLTPAQDVVDMKFDENTPTQEISDIVTVYPKLESPKVFEEIAKEMPISDRKSIEMEIEDTGGGVIHVDVEQTDPLKQDDAFSEISTGKSNIPSPSRTGLLDSKVDASKKNTLAGLEHFRIGTFGESLKQTAELNKNTKLTDKKFIRENLKTKHGSLINKMPLPPGMKSTDLESIDSPPSRSPSPVIEKKKPKSVKSIKDLPLPPGKRSHMFRL